ncbi:hypothetical protein NEUTE2DRAFT_155572 [Neurospora tetrasperma FGSC 2509]|nr:hypothetical protein NEUTE2DRAFT_155572 [Neurospora tetrasperma FGSC 2509]
MAAWHEETSVTGGIVDTGKGSQDWSLQFVHCAERRPLTSPDPLFPMSEVRLASLDGKQLDPGDGAVRPMTTSPSRPVLVLNGAHVLCGPCISPEMEASIGFGGSSKVPRGDSGEVCLGLSCWRVDPSLVQDKITWTAAGPDY